MDNDLLGPPGQSRESRRQRVIHILWNEGIRITRELEVHGRNATALERNQLTAIEDILEWTITDGFDSMKELLCVALWNALDSRCVAGKDANLTEIAAVRLLAALMDRGVIRMYASRCRLEDWADMADLGFEAALHRTVQRSRSEELTALASIRSRPFHTGGHLSGTWTRRISQQVIRVGVPFRTDSRGVAHTTHDLPGIRAINNIANIGRHVQFRVEPVTLPQGASGADTPERPDPPIDLYGIHILYIPGGPSANDTQVGNTQEEIDFQRAIVGRALAEHTSRSRYELRLIQIARTRGIPMLAVCAGSWRLLEAFGGQVRTLPDNLRTRHRNPDALWQTTHGVSIEARTLLRDILQVPSLANTNTTHWAVADTTSRDELVNRGSSDPLKGLQISARAYGQSLPRTVEGFETINGAMTLGIQWHPESSLPGMPGREVSPEQDKASDRLFRAYAISGQTRLRQNAVIAELHVRRLYVVLGMRDMAHAEAVWMDIYGYYGREPTQRDIDDYLRAFNLSYT